MNVTELMQYLEIVGVVVGVVVFYFFQKERLQSEVDGLRRCFDRDIAETRIDLSTNYEKRTEFESRIAGMERGFEKRLDQIEVKLDNVIRFLYDGREQ